MHAITHPMQNTGISAMQNAMNAAQGSILGQAQMAGYQSAEQSRRIESWFDHQRNTNFQIVTADNGFVVIVKADGFGQVSRILVANTIEEVRDLITSEMVAKKLEK